MIYEGIDRWNSPYLDHHGVKGMKWGVRKSRVKQAVNSLSRYHEKVAKKYNYRSDTINDRIQDRVKSFKYNVETHEQIINAKGLRNKGKVFANRFLNKPVRIYGAAGSVETTRGQMLSGKNFVESLYARNVVANVGYKK